MSEEQKVAEPTENEEITIGAGDEKPGINSEADKTQVSEKTMEIPALFKEDPALSKFKSVEDLATSYKNLQSQMGKQFKDVKSYEQFKQYIGAQYGDKHGEWEYKFEDVPENRAEMLTKIARDNVLHPGQAAALSEIIKTYEDESKAASEESKESYQKNLKEYITKNPSLTDEMKELAANLGDKKGLLRDYLKTAPDLQVLEILRAVKDNVVANNAVTSGDLPLEHQLESIDAIDAEIEAIKGDMNSPYWNENHARFKQDQMRVNQLLEKKAKIWDKMQKSKDFGVNI